MHVPQVRLLDWHASVNNFVCPAGYILAIIYCTYLVFKSDFPRFNGILVYILYSLIGWHGVPTHSEVGMQDPHCACTADYLQDVRGSRMPHLVQPSVP
jgi:hypothetical protein